MTGISARPPTTEPLLDEPVVWLRHWKQRIQYQNTTEVMYNRLNKCGSSTLRSMFLSTQTAHNVQFDNWVYFPKRENFQRSFYWSLEEQTEFWKKTELESNDRPTAKDRNTLHIHHAYFSEQLLRERAPIYMNIVREPVSRLESLYNWKVRTVPKVYRQKDQWGKSLQDCIEKRLACTNVFGSGNQISSNQSYWWSPHAMLYYFCGTEIACYTNLTFAFERAKYNVVQNYIIVGITEQFKESLEVLEFLLPEYFKDLSHLKSQAKNVHRHPPLKGNSRALIQGMLKIDTDFYNYCKKLFNNRLQFIRKLKQEGVEDRLSYIAA